MNRTRLLMIGVVALGLAAFVAFKVYRALLAGSGANQQTAEVLVAANDIPIGAKIEDKDVRAVRFSVAELPANCYHLKSSVVGRGAVVPIARGEFFLPNKLAGENAGFGLPSLIPPGMRAVSVRANEVIGVAGFVVPGTARAADHDRTRKRGRDREWSAAGEDGRRRAPDFARDHAFSLARRRAKADPGHHPGKNSAGIAQSAGYQILGTGCRENGCAV
ncbi:MAG: Flp pilus assembly protein CpaB [Acidobacteria bacterium]|nr:MAG: Flp pilus assembly protein CpaB [Acidobacteriota bacterium]